MSGATRRTPPRRGVEKKETAPRGASVGRLGAGLRLRNYFVNHLQALISSLGRLMRRPISTLMTTAVLGIALALPAGLHVLLKNAEVITSGWDGATRISLFLKHKTSERQARRLAEELTAKGEIASVRYISPQQALEEFRELSGFGDAIDALAENPLPAVLVVHPTLTATDPKAMEQMLARLRAHPLVDMAQLDMQWVKRLHALMEIGRRAVWVLASLLALAVLLVIGNTVRLAIQNRREEIVITKLIGGTNAFIRRPFLYTGLWYGLAGGVIGFALIEISLWLLQAPVQGLALLYHSQFRLDTLDGRMFLALLAAGALLGLVGSWLAVGRHLREIEP